MKKKRLPNHYFLDIFSILHWLPEAFVPLFPTYKMGKICHFTQENYTKRSFLFTSCSEL